MEIHKSSMYILRAAGHVQSRRMEIKFQTCTKNRVELDIRNDIIICKHV